MLIFFFYQRFVIILLIINNIMTTIILEIDESSAVHYDNFSLEIKKKVNWEVSGIIRKVLFDERVTTLKKMVDGINNDPGCLMLNHDVLAELLRVEVD